MPCLKHWYMFLTSGYKKFISRHLADFGKQFSKLHKTARKTDDRLASIEKLVREFKKKTPPRLNAEDRVAFWRLPAVASCPFCRQESVDHVSRYQSVAGKGIFHSALICWCSKCGSGYVLEGDKLLGNYYAVDYANLNRKDRDVDPETYFSDAHRDSSGSIQRYFERANSHLGLILEAGGKMDTVLDFGSGPGYFLFASQAKEKLAIEPDTKSGKYLDYIGARVVSLNDLQPESLDVIEASHSIEHLTGETVESTVATLVRALKPGGVMLVEVPQGGISYLDLPHRHEPHTLFFTPEGLRSLLTIDGTSIVMAKTRSQIDYSPSPKAIYRPDPDDLFASVRRNGLTVILRKD